MFIKAINGDREACTQLVKLYYEQFYYWAFSFCINNEIAKDAVQELFIKILRGIPTYRRGESFLAYLFVVLQRITSKLADKERREVNIENYNSINVDAVDHFKSLRDKEEKDQIIYYVMISLAELPKHYQYVLTLKYFGGLSDKEIAENLNETVSAIQNRAHRARTALRDKIERYL